MKKLWAEFKDFMNQGDFVTIAVGLIIALQTVAVVNAIIDGDHQPDPRPPSSARTASSQFGFDIGDARISIGLVISALINFVADPRHRLPPAEGVERHEAAHAGGRHRHRAQRPSGDPRQPEPRRLTAAALRDASAASTVRRARRGPRPPAGRHRAPVSGAARRRRRCRRPAGRARRAHGRERPPRSVGQLEGDRPPVGQRRGQHPLGAVLGHEPGHGLHQRGDVPPGPADHVRVGRHRDADRRHRRAGRRAGHRGEGAGEAGQGEGVGGRAATVDADVGDRLAAEPLHHGRDVALERVVLVEVGVERPAVDRAGDEHPRVLARAVLQDGGAVDRRPG